MKSCVFYIFSHDKLVLWMFMKNCVFISTIYFPHVLISWVWVANRLYEINWSTFFKYYFSCWIAHEIHCIVLIILSSLEKVVPPWIHEIWKYDAYWVVRYSFYSFVLHRPRLSWIWSFLLCCMHFHVLHPYELLVWRCFL